MYVLDKNNTIPISCCSGNGSLCCKSRRRSAVGMLASSERTQAASPDAQGPEKASNQLRQTATKPALVLEEEGARERTGEGTNVGAFLETEET